MKSSYFIIALIALIGLFTVNATAQTVASEARPIGLIFTVQGSTFPEFGNYLGGIGVQKYVTSDVSVRGSIGGSFNDSVSSYVASAAGLVDIMTTSNTAAYVGVGTVYTHPAGAEDDFSFFVPIGARISLFPNTTVGAEYITTISADPFNINLGGATAAGHLTFWF